MDIKNPERKYRPIPFWSWNEILNREETKRQIEMIKNIGMGGYFMHARGGLQTQYMGEEWFENIEIGVEEGKRYGMTPWAYDENGWPSGFGNGLVNGLGLAYQQKYLRMEEGEGDTEHTICNKDNIHFYYEVNPYYVDTLYKKGTEVFIEKIYKPYYDRYKNDIEGFFTDEPQISRNGIPWSFFLPEEYKKAYGEELLEHLVELFKPLGDYKKTRFQFWKLITDLFSANFMKPIYDWCESHHLKLTGHLVLEETLETQLISNGAVMPHYEFFHIPGIDWLTRNIFPCLLHHQVVAVAHQLGRKQILTESFALCGHNVGFDELKRIMEWQMVRGVTLLCPHLQGYSLRGIRKRDYPPAMYYQQPWWEEYSKFIDAMSRVGMMLTEGEVQYDTLLIHPQSTAWIYYNNNQNEGLSELHRSFIETIEALEKKHILFHLGDETIMARHGKVEGNKLVVGTQSYSVVLLPKHEILFSNTERLLKEFQEHGGTVVYAEEISNLKSNDILDNENITYTKRLFQDYIMHYFVNTTEEPQEANINCRGRILELETGELSEFNGMHSFSKYESLIIIEDRRDITLQCHKKQEMQEQQKKQEILHLDGSWNKVKSTPNSLTLDFCDYYFDGELIERNGYVLNIQNRALALKRPVKIRCEYTVAVEHIPKALYLVTETPEIFVIRINGEVLTQEDCGYFVDSAFRKFDISKYIGLGYNKITFELNFKQSSMVYDNLDKSLLCESEKNKLTYDMEIEPVYLVGDFGVKAHGVFEALERDAVRFKGRFAIAKDQSSFSLTNIEQQGYPFFAGTITFHKKYNLSHTNYSIQFKKMGINAVKIQVNGGEEKTFLWEPQKMDISSMLQIGENEIEITLVNNLRNLLGPHHLSEGESFIVGPHSFYKENCVWNMEAEKDWNEDYCFVNMSLV